MNIISDGEDDFTGDIGTVISGNTGPVHLGKGNIITNSSVITGDGVTVIAGDNPNGIRKSFTTKKRK